MNSAAFFEHHLTQEASGSTGKSMQFENKGKSKDSTSLETFHASVTKHNKFVLTKLSLIILTIDRKTHTSKGYCPSVEYTTMLNT